MHVITRAEFHSGTPANRKITPPGTRCTPADLEIAEADVDRYVAAGVLWIADPEPAPAGEAEGRPR